MTAVQVWRTLSVVMDVYESIKGEMIKEMDTCDCPDDFRYLLLDVCRRKAGLDPMDVLAGKANEVDIDAVDHAIDFYIDLRDLKHAVRKMLVAADSS